MKLKNLPMDKVISDYQAGMNFSQIARKYGVSYPTIRRRLEKKMEQVKSPFYLRVSASDEELVSEYLSGTTVKDLAEYHNVDKQAIYYRLKRIIKQDLRSVNLTKEQVLDLYVAYISGASVSTLEQDSNLNYRTIVGSFKHCNLPYPVPKKNRKKVGAILLKNLKA